MEQKAKRVYRWAKIGVIFGLVVAIADFSGWRGEMYPPDAGIHIIIAQILGSMAGGAILFSIPAFITTLILRDEK